MKKYISSHIFLFAKEMQKKLSHSDGRGGKGGTVFQEEIRPGNGFKADDFVKEK